MYSFPSRSQTREPFESPRYSGYGGLNWIALPTPPGITFAAASHAAFPFGVLRSYSSTPWVMVGSLRRVVEACRGLRIDRV